MSYVSVAAIQSIIANPQTPRPYAEVYDYILSTMTTNGEPLAGVDIQAWQWFKGAAEVNRGQGTFSDFIRTYTSEQAYIRGGSHLTKAQLDAASDSIAMDLIAGIVENNGRVPAIAEIGQYDITNTANSIFQGNNAGWSGNPLFLMLGNQSFFNTNIIESDGDTYDALAMLRASNVALEGQLTNVTALYDIGKKMAELLTGSTSTTTVPDLIDASVNLSSFFDRSYGDSLRLIPSLIETTFSDGIVLGKENTNDNLVVTNLSGVINTGNFDDFISFNSFQGLVDGSSGIDTLNYLANQGLNFDLGYAGVRSLPSPAANFIGAISSGVVAAGPAANTSYIFNIENIVLSNFDDTLKIKSISSENANTSISGAGGVNTLINDSSVGAIFNINSKTFTIGSFTVNTSNFSSYIGGEGDDIFIGATDASTMDGGEGIDTISFESSSVGITLLPLDFNASGIERILGSSYDDVFDLRTNTLTSWISDENIEIDGGGGDDVLDGTDVSNHLLGGLGDDVIHGWAGSDIIAGGDGDDLLVGGEGFYYFAGDDDLILGGAGNDTLDGGAGNDHLIGGGGSDVLIGGAGDDVLEGGDASDFLSGGDGNDTLIISKGSNFNGGLGNDTFIPVGISTPEDAGIVFLWGPGQGSDTLTSIDQGVLSSGNTNYGFDRVILSGVSLSDLSISWFPKFMYDETWVRDIGYSSPNIQTTVSNYYMGDLEILILSTGEKLTIEGQWGGGGYTSDSRGNYSERSPVSFDFIFVDRTPVIVDNLDKNVDYNVFLQSSDNDRQVAVNGQDYSNQYYLTSFDPVAESAQVDVNVEYNYSLYSVSDSAEYNHYNENYVMSELFMVS